MTHDAHAAGSTAGPKGPAVDWEDLRAQAADIMTRAYVPYSNYPVGVAGLVDDGRVVRGCNVENASYGLTLCAECGMTSELAATGGGRVLAGSRGGGDGPPLLPRRRGRGLVVGARGAA